MANIYEETSDILFQIEHCIDWDKVIPLRERNFVDAKEYEKTKDGRYENAPTNTEEAIESYKTILEAFGDIISTELLPYTQEIDKKGLTLKDGKVTFPEPMTRFINTLRDSGLLPFAHRREYGGYNLSFVARQPIMEMVYGSDIATGIVMGYFNMAEVIEKFGSDEMKKKYLPMFGQGKIL
ncbi:MAG: acyl-CoA dehydrogenase family protein, partial [Leptospiraceae bacterium]|nr:acyl-CoA dehydrogenase family protein [Leptospiraceae bacterium]